jgi:outer membrane protein
MSRKNLAGWILAGTVACVPLARAEDLSAIVDKTLGHDAELAQARAAYEAAKQAIPVARAALLPQVAGGWGRTYNRIDVEDFPRQSYWQSGWMVNVSQPLFDWSKWTAFKQSDYVAARGVTDLAGAQQGAMLRAVKAYFEELASEDELKRTIDYGAAIEAQAQEISRKRAAGEATLIDVRDAEVAREQAQLQRLDAQEELFIKRRAVESVSGQPFTALAALPGVLPLPRLSPESAEVWVDEARSRGYEVQSRQLDWEIAKLDTQKARAAGYPVVNLTGSYTPAGALCAADDHDHRHVVRERATAFGRRDPGACQAIPGAGEQGGTGFCNRLATGRDFGARQLCALYPGAREDRDAHASD